MKIPKFPKYSIALIPYVFFCILTAIIFYNLNVYMPLLFTEDVAYYIPFIGWIEEVFMFSVLFPMFALIGVLIGTFFAPILTLLHKKTLGRNMDYGFEKVHKSTRFRRIFQGFFPGLMAMNFAALIADNPFVQELLLTQWMLDLNQVPGFNQMITFIGALPLTLIISFTLFSALWSLSDAGIVFSNRKAVERKGKEKPIMGQSVGGWYNYILKGYAGIGALVVYYELVIIFFNVFDSFSLRHFEDWVNVYLFLLYPLLLTIFTIPTIIVADIFRDKRVGFAIKQARKLGITKNVTITLQEVDR